MAEAVFNFANPATFAMASAKSHVTPITLDPKSFAVLAATVRAGLTLPRDRGQFEQMYNRQAFEQTLARDMSVYDRLAINFESIWHLSSEFRQRGAPAMIGTGQMITGTSQRAIEFMSQVKHLISTGFDSNARDNVLLHLDDLSDRARQLASEAEHLSGFLAGFKVRSNQCFDELNATTSRWNDVAIPNAEREKQIHEQVRQMEYLIEQARQQTEQAEREKANAEAWNKTRWMLNFAVGPFAGAAILIGEKAFGKNVDELRNRANALSAQYNAMVAKAGADTHQLMAAQMTMQLLRNTMDDMRTQSSDIRDSLKQIYIAATRMITDNEDLSRKIKALDEDLDAAEEVLEEHNADAIKELLTDSIEDIEECLAMWQQVEHVGEEFERGGRLAMD